MEAALEKRQLVNFFGHLHRQFPRGTENEHLRGGFRDVYLFNRRRGESSGFAGAGL